MRIRTAGLWIGWIFAASSVDVVEPLCFQVIRLQVIVANLPCRRDAAELTDFAEVFLAKPEKRRAVKFCVASHIIVGVGVEELPILVAPLLFSLILGLDVHRARVPVRLFPADVISALQNQNVFS